jgi:hypothetical protein
MDIEFKFKRWDVRKDGKVFWRYEKNYKNGQRWVCWEQAVKYQDYILKHSKLYRQTQKHTDYRRLYISSQKYLNYKKSRYASDPMYAMTRRLSNRICKAINSKGYSKTSKTSEMLGCDWNHLMAHLEAKFVDGMTWGNRHLWHIDHITPLASATSEEELIKLNHYTNLQPLWAEDNLRKGNRICANVRGTGRKPS